MLSFQWFRDKDEIEKMSSKKLQSDWICVGKYTYKGK